MWAQVILEALAAAPTIIRAIERVMPGRARGPEKLDAAVAQQKAFEPMVVETESLVAARAVMLSAQADYANALQAASSTHGA